MPRSVSSDRNEDNIKVVVRARPMNAEEKRLKQPCLVTCDEDSRSVAVSQVIGNKKGSKTYTFDTVFSPYSSQEDVYVRSVKPIVQDVLLGFNCTVFAYGQTGTGKTYTMEGDLKNDVKKGMIPRAVESLFEQLPMQNQSEFSAKVSFLELYNEELFDLLTDLASQTTNSRSGVRLVDDKSKQVVCQNLTEILVNNLDDVLKVMEKALSRRQTAETKLNKASSRSHCIFTLTVHIRERTVEGEDLVKVGKLNLVDLAGSESVGRAGGNDKRMREAGNINKSLLTLGRVITALVEKTPHIPYRDSKLTRLLQESLGGRAKTLVIATVGPSLHSLEETISTLDYASRAKSIKNKPKANKKLTKHELIKEYVEDMERMRKELEAARSKDGVWMSQEQYDTMHAQLETQEKQIANMEKGLSGREEEIEQKNIEIHQLTESLSLASQNICRLEEEATQMREQIASLQYEVKENQFIIEEHQVTEGKLVSQVSDLKQTLEECKRDNELLHQKANKQSQLETSNFNHIDDYEVSTKKALGELLNTSSEFETKNALFFNQILEGITLSFAKDKKEREVIRSTIKNMVKKGLESQSCLFEKHASCLQSISKEEIETLPPLLKTSINEIITTTESVINTSREFSKETCAFIENQTIEPLKSLDSLLVAKLSDFQKSYSEQEKVLKEKLQNFIENISKARQQEDKRISLHQEAIQAYAEKEEVRWKALEVSMEQRFRLMLQEMKNDSLKSIKEKVDEDQLYLSTSSTINNNFESICKEYTTSQSEVSNSMGEQVISVSNEIANVSKTNLDGIRDKCITLQSNEENEQKRVERVLSEVIDVSNKLQTTHKSKIDTLKNNINQELNTVNEGVEQISQYFTTQNTNATELFEKLEITSKERVEQLKSDLSLTKESIDSYCGSSNTFRYELETDITDLLKKKLKKYTKGSPQTPTKKEYLFDNSNYLTLPIENLKEKLKLSLLEITTDIDEDTVEADKTSNSLQDIFQENDQISFNKENQEPNLDDLKVKDLRKLLAEKGLSQVGRKAELKRRLVENT